ncbi:MAG TPA: WYL domain-containing protein [Candidatus Limnocylindrales bacterium]|jgi:proteasome accessory factor B
MTDVEPLTGTDDRYAAKRDRLARLLRVVAVLRAHTDGIRPAEIARRIDVSPRTVYRDLKALEQEVGVAVWSEGGKWGVVGDEFLPPLKLTLAEAMAVVLSARLMVRYADKYDPDLAAAFEKLEGILPPALAEHVDRTLDVLSRHPRDERFSGHVHLLTRAWAERRVVTVDYDPAKYGKGAERRRATVRPYLIEPSLQTHALYLIGWDETRGAVRTFKIERIRDVALLPRTFEPPTGGAIEGTFRRAWDIIADQAEVEVVLRFAPSVALRVRETNWHPGQSVEEGRDGSLVWRARVAGTIEIRLWILSWGDEVEVLEPADLRADVAATHRRALARYEGPPS